MKYTVEDVPYLSLSQKQALYRNLDRKKELLSKLVMGFIIIHFLIIGVIGWVNFIGDSYGVGLSPIQIQSISSFVFLIAGWIIGYSFEKKKLYTACGFFAISFLTIPYVYRFIVLFIALLYYLMSFYVPIYEELKKQEGFPYFFDINEFKRKY